MGRIGDIADLVTGLALLGGGYLIYRAVKDAGDIIPELPGWPELPSGIWPWLPSMPGSGLLDRNGGSWIDDNGGLGNGVGGGGGGVRNGNGSNGVIITGPAPWELPKLPDEPWGKLENGYPGLNIRTSPKLPLIPEGPWGKLEGDVL